MQIAACGLLVAFVAYASAQEAATFSTDVKVVSVLATVHDREGRIVKDLNQDDFTLLEDGVPQKIRYFSRETGLPLTIGLLVDTSRSQTGVLEQGAPATSFSTTSWVKTGTPRSSPTSTRASRFSRT